MNRPSVHGARIFWRPFFLILAAVLPAAFADEGAAVNNIPLLLDQLSGRIVAKVVMGEGQPQTVNFAVSTGMRYSAVRSTACTECVQTNAFNPSLSTTFQAVDGTATSRYGGVDFSGGLMRENCGLVKTTPGSWSWPNQTLVVSRPTAASVLSDAITGIMGLGTSAPPGGDKTDTVLGSWLRRNPTNTSFDIGFALNDLTAVIKRDVEDNEEDTGAGQLHFAATNSSFFDPSTLVWSSASNSVVGPSGDDSGGFPSDFVFTLDNWTFTGPNQFVISSEEDAQATFEPLLPAIIFPSRFANSIAGSISGAQEVAYSDPKQWTVPCETTGLKWTATYAGLPIPAENLIHKRPDGSCVGVIQGWRDESVNSFLLGSPAMANAYIIHQTTRDGDNKVGVASRVFPKRSASSRAGLIGGVVGGVIAALLIVGVVLFIFRKKLRREERTYVNENAPVTPFMSETAASAPATATAFPLGPPTAASVAPSQYGHAYSPVPVTEASTSADVGGTFAAQQSAALANMRDAKGRQMYTAAAPASAADSNLYPRSASPSAESSALSSVPSSRRPMLPPAYQG